MPKLEDPAQFCPPPEAAKPGALTLVFVLLLVAELLELDTLMAFAPMVTCANAGVESPKANTTPDTNRCILMLTSCFQGGN